MLNTATALAQDPTPPRLTAASQVPCSTTFAKGRSHAHIPAAASIVTANGVDGKPVNLSELTAKGPVVIFTFIAAFTPT